MDGTSYPVSFSVGYPDRELDRMTSFFRIFTVIPIGIDLADPGFWDSGLRLVETQLSEAEALAAQR